MEVGVVADDPDGFLVGPHGTIGAQAPEFAGDGALRGDVQRLPHRQGSEAEVVVDPDGEAILGLILLEVVEHGGDLRRRGVLGAQTVPAPHHRRPALQRLASLDHIQIQGLPGGTGLFRPVQNGDLADRWRQSLQEMALGKGSVQTHLHHTHPAALLAQVVHGAL